MLQGSYVAVPVGAVSVPIAVLLHRVRATLRVLVRRRGGEAG